MSLVKVPYIDATAKQLRYFAGTVLGLEVSNTENGGSMRSKIEVARPGITEIEVSDELVEKFVGHTPTAADLKDEPKTKIAIPTGPAGLHSAYDPKVKLMVFATSDPTKPKDVQIAVGGDALLLQRDKEVSIPYRHYLVLRDARESVARDTGDINPATQMPIKEWVDQASYPHQVLERPTADEIEAWEKRTAAIVMA